MAKKKTRFEKLLEAGRKKGRYASRHCPGDGVCRYQFSSKKSNERDFFAVDISDRQCSVSGMKAAEAFVRTGKCK